MWFVIPLFVLLLLAMVHHLTLLLFVVVCHSSPSHATTYCDLLLCVNTVSYGLFFLPCGIVV
jgi:hypothetical protein